MQRTATHCNTLQHTASDSVITHVYHSISSNVLCIFGRCIHDTSTSCHTHGQLAVCCSVLQCVAVRCSVLQYVTPHAWTSSCTHVDESRHKYITARRGHGSVLQCVAACCSVLQCVAVCCSVLQCVAVCCSVLQCVAA